MKHIMVRKSCTAETDIELSYTQGQAQKFMFFQKKEGSFL